MKIYIVKTYSYSAYFNNGNGEGISPEKDFYFKNKEGAEKFISEKGYVIVDVDKLNDPYTQCTFSIGKLN